MKYRNNLLICIFFPCAGSGDRKQIQHPTEVKIRTDSQPDTVINSSAKSSDIETNDFKTSALVACGGDFTVYIDNDGRIYSTGNSHLQVSFTNILIYNYLKYNQYTVRNNNDYF